MFAQGGALWTPSGQTATTTTRQVAIKTITPTADLDVNGSLRIRGMASFDTSLTAKLITGNAIRVLGLAQLDALLVNGNTQLNGVLTVGSFQINNSSIISSTGNILFGNNNLSTTGNVNAANITDLQSKVDNQQTEIDTLQNEMLNVQSSMFNVQSAITAHDTAIGALHDTLSNLQSQFSNLNSSQWLNDTVNPENIFYDGGKVGIGTSSPAAKLDVFGSQRITGNLFVGGELSVSDKFSAQTIVTDTIKPTVTGAAVQVAAPMQAQAIRVDTLLVNDKFTAENSISSDTLVAVKQLDVNHNLSLGSDSGSAESDIASRVDVLTIQSDPAKALNTAINADNSGKVGIGTRTPTEKLSVDGNVSVSGNLRSASITTANLFIDDKIESDTMHARKSLMVNNSLKLVRDTAEMYAEVSTRDTAVALMLQKEAQASVVIGDAPTPTAGEAKPKLTVIGNTKLDGAVNVTGNISTAGTITANTFNAEKFSSDTLFVTRILPAVGDSEIHFGDSSIVINGIANSIKTIKKGSNGSLFLQNQPLTPSTPDFDATNNTILNPFMGNVGIGTTNPQTRLDVNGPIRIERNINLETSVWDLEPLLPVNSLPARFQIGTPGNPLLTLTEDDGINIKNKLRIGTLSNPPIASIHDLSIHSSNTLSVMQWANSTTGYNEFDGFVISSTGSDVQLNLLENGNMSFFNGAGGANSVKMVIDQNGNVGIGTTIPVANLQVTNTDVDGINGKIFSLTKNTDELFSVAEDGNVGIGAPPSTDHRLNVCGTIRSTEWIVETISGCDFVFEKNYELNPFKERMNQIMKNKRLPYIASANDMQKKGAYIGESFIGLLRNTEELYLYLNIMEQEKETQKQKIETLEKRIMELEKKMGDK